MIAFRSRAEPGGNPKGDSDYKARERAHDPELPYAQLASALGVSKRFLQLRVKEGMPDVGLDYAGRRRFRLSEVTAWLDARQERLGRTVIGARSPLHREEAS